MYLIEYFVAAELCSTLSASVSIGQNLCGRGNAAKNKGSVKRAKIGVDKIDEKISTAIMNGENTTLS